MLQTETPEFVPPQLWPPNSQDLNPVDYSVLGLLQDVQIMHHCSWRTEAAVENGVGQVRSCRHCGSSLSVADRISICPMMRFTICAN